MRHNIIQKSDKVLLLEHLGINIDGTYMGAQNLDKIVRLEYSLSLDC